VEVDYVIFNSLSRDKLFSDNSQSFGRLFEEELAAETSGQNPYFYYSIILLMPSKL